MTPPTRKQWRRRCAKSIVSAVVSTLCAVATPLWADPTPAKEKVAKEKVAKEKVAKEKVAKEKVAKEKVAKEKAAREIGRYRRPVIARVALRARVLGRIQRATRRASPRRASPRRASPRKASPPPRPLASRLVGWGAGEQMTFEARFAGIEAARIAVAIGRPRGPAGRRTVRVRGRSEAIPAFAAFYALREDLVTTVDLAGVLPLRSRLVARKGSRVTTTTTEHGTTRHARTRQWVRRGKPKARPRWRGLGRLHHDPLSALLTLRSLSGGIGERFAITMLTGRKVYRLSGRVAAKDRRRRGGRTVDCLRLEGQLWRVDDRGRALRKPRRGFKIWLSDERARVPIAAEIATRFGTLTIALTSYRPARRPLRVRTVVLH